MQYISVTDARKTLGAVIEKTQLGPVIIQKQNRDAAVIISREDYKRLTKLNIEEFQKFRGDVAERAAAHGLTESKLNKILDQ